MFFCGWRFVEANAAEIDQFNEHLPMETKHKANLALLALIAAGLLAVPPEKSQAQEPENFAWITNTNGITWKRKIVIPRGDAIARLEFENGLEGESEEPDKLKIASILVPEHAIINEIHVDGCVNLTNIVIQPARAGYGYSGSGRFRTSPLTITGENSGLRNITAQRTMMNSIRFRFSSSIPFWVLNLQWTEPEPEPEPAPIEIKTHATDNGNEVEVIWREGTLQIADAVSGEWRDHLGSSPLRFPLLSAKTCNSIA